MIPIPVPPLPEQRRIVGLLDEAFAGIATAKANAKKNLQNARDLFESHLHAVFTQRGKGWVAKRWRSSTNLDNDRSPSRKRPRAANISVLWSFRHRDYVAGFISEGDTLLVAEDGANC